jgi:hypothetical protein
MSIEAYFDAGMVVGLLVGCLTFLAAYVYCAYAYGIPKGLGLGWLPSGILAVAVGWFAMVVWPVPVVLTGIMFFLFSGRNCAQRRRKADRDGQKRRTGALQQGELSKPPHPLPRSRTHSQNAAPAGDSRARRGQHF